MRLSKLCILMAFVASVLSLSSCSLDFSSGVKYLPFKSSEEGKWGLIDLDGNVLFEEEFKEEPAYVRNGRFFVKNNSGLYNMYNISEKPEKIGAEYLEVTPFYEDVAAVVKKNEKISIIDKNGNVKAVLDKAGGRSIIRCSSFWKGYAMIMTDDSKWGVIDTKGKIIVQPKYDDIEIVSGKKFIGTVYGKGTDDSKKVHVLSNSGDQIMTMNVGKGQKYAGISADVSTDDYLAVYVKEDGEWHYGFITYDKDVKIKPSKKIRKVLPYKIFKCEGWGNDCDDMFIFKNDNDEYGIMNMNGDVVLRPKYSELLWAGDGLLLSDHDYKVSIIDVNGDKVAEDIFALFIDENHGVAGEDDDFKNPFLVDKDLKERKTKVDIYKMGDFYPGSRGIDRAITHTISSDFVDMDQVVSNIALQKNGMLGFNISMKPFEIAKQYKAVSTQKGVTCDYVPDAEPSSWISYNWVPVEFTKQLTKGVEASFKVIMFTSMTEGVNYDYYYGGYQSYRWGTNCPDRMELAIYGDKLEGKTSSLYAKLSSKIKGLGKVYKENKAAVIVKTQDGRGWVLIDDKESNKVLLTLYSTSEDLMHIDISRYDSSDNSSNSYSERDSVVCDTL